MVLWYFSKFDEHFSSVGHPHQLLDVCGYYQRNKDCVMQCQAEIRQNSLDCSLDDVIRIHKRLCKQMSSTSESLKVWFVTHWFMLATTTVIYVASMVSYFQQAIDWYILYQHLLRSFIHLYIFVYPSYCAASVTTQCNRMLRELNMTTDEDWSTGHPFCNRSQLALFLQYAQYTNRGNLVPRVFSLSNMAAAGEKTLAHSRNHVTDLSTESGNLFKMAAKLKSERIWVRGLETGGKQTKWRQRQTH